MFTRRLIAACAVLMFLALAVLLLLSDRAGASLGDVVSFVTRAGRKIERDAGINVLDRSDIPGRADQIVHTAFWGTGMLLIGWVLRRRVPVAITALFVGGISLGFEVAQPQLSATRAVEVSDATANLIGVGLATTLLLVVVPISRRLFGDDRHDAYYDTELDASYGPGPQHSGRQHSGQQHRADVTEEMLIPFHRDDKTEEFFLPSK